MHFTIKKTKEDGANPYDDDSPLVPIDVLTVDSQYRVTFTRHLKKMLGILPKDRIIVYHAQYNKDKSMIFKVHRDEGIVNSWTLTQNSNGNSKDISKASINNLNAANNKTFFDTSNNDNSVDKIHTTDHIYQTPILLVDDEKDLLYTFESLLKYEGYENVKAFCDSKEVLKSFADMATFKLAILDIRMPDINGLQLYNILKTLNPSIKILFISALDSVNELTSFMADINPIEDVMRKPIDANQFIERVTNKIKVLS